MNENQRVVLNYLIKRGFYSPFDAIWQIQDSAYRNNLPKEVIDSSSMLNAFEEFEVILAYSKHFLEIGGLKNE